MSYVTEILQPSEKILSIGKLHWMIYLPAIMWMIVGVITMSVLGLVFGSYRSYCFRCYLLHRRRFGN